MTRANLPNEFTYVVVAAFPFVILQPVLELDVHCFEWISNLVGLQVDAAGLGCQPCPETILFSTNGCI